MYYTLDLPTLQREQDPKSIKKEQLYHERISPLIYQHRRITQLKDNPASELGIQEHAAFEEHGVSLDTRSERNHVRWLLK